MTVAETMAACIRERSLIYDVYLGWKTKFLYESRGGGVSSILRDLHVFKFVTLHATWT
jgi:hypothetical protein